MIVVDTSALMAVLRGEPPAQACLGVLRSGEPLVMSAGTLAEALVVAGRRRALELMLGLIADLGITIEPLTRERAKAVGRAHEDWGRGAGSAGLNFGDCFAYALAKELDAPLLFIGNDFGKTDVKQALA